MKKVYFGIAALLCPEYVDAQNEDQPNFVFYMAEDVSKHNFQLYNEDGRGAHTPILEQIAKQGILFENAFCSAPVSSAARSTLITSCYAPRLGISWHRRLQPAVLPEGQHMFPTYLRRSGYYTTSGKTDYNCVLDKEAWDHIGPAVGSWRNRKDKTQPFFVCYTNASCHASSLNFPASDLGTVPVRYNVDDVQPYPNQVDTELLRYTFARLYDRINDVDTAFGRMIEMLKADGELDNTFIFYMGDNGGSMPFSKGYTNELGLNVPLVVYVPAKWKDKVPFKIGSSTECFVNFMDLGPTLLNLAGITIPSNIDGEAFMGDNISKKDLKTRNTVFGYGDRYDELYAMNRTVRKDHLKYSRNFFPYHPKSLYCLARYRHAAVFELEDLYNEGKLNEVQKRFFEPQGVEELYDLEVDPFETRNLANDVKYKGVLTSLRSLVKENMTTMNDLGFIPESEWALSHRIPADYGKENSENIKRYSDVIDLQLFPYAEARSGIVEALNSKDWVERYWAVVVCCSFGQQAGDLIEDVQKLGNDRSALVISKSAVYLAQNNTDPLPLLKKSLKRVKNGAETWQILNDATYLRSRDSEYDIVIKLEDLGQYTGIIQPLLNRLDYLK